MTYTMHQLQRELDRCKSAIFLRRDQAHLAQLLCSTPVIWAEDAVTSYTNGMMIAANPAFFMQLPAESRETLIASKLWNIGMLHLVRGAGKDWRLWNIAASYWINNMLHTNGYSMDGLKPWLDHRYDDLAVEQIYEDLVIRDANGTMDDPGALWGYTDPDGNYDTMDLRHPTEAWTSSPSGYIPPTDPNLAQKMLNAVVQATQYAAQQHGGWAGGDPMADLVSQFLQPKIKWEKEVEPFLTALDNWDYDYAIPNRRLRVPGVFLPSLRKGNQGGLDHIAWFGDSSGSMTKSQLVRWNSEARYLHQKFKPEKFTMINFDDDIQMVLQMGRHDPFNEIQVMGRGGTHLEPVRQWIIENKPKAVIIFTDMGCDEMVPLPKESMVPILWIVLNNPNAQVPHGRMVHISE